MRKVPRRIVELRSDEALAEVAAVSIRLESGRVARFDVADELAVSHDPDTLREQAMAAHSRYAFWEYQAARAMRLLRDQEVDLARLEGDLRYRYSKVLKADDQYTSSATVEGTLAGDKRVLAARNRLNLLREHWTIIRALADAHDHRAHLLRRLLAKDQDLKV